MYEPYRSGKDCVAAEGLWGVHPVGFVALAIDASSSCKVSAHGLLLCIPSAGIWSFSNITAVSVDVWPIFNGGTESTGSNNQRKSSCGKRKRVDCDPHDLQILT